MAKIDIDTLLDGLIERILSGNFKNVGNLWVTQRGGGVLPRNLTSGRRYQGVNSLTLMAAAMDHGYKSPCWTTASQCSNLGGHIRKGESCHYVVVWSPRDRLKKNEDGSEEKTKSLFCRLHAVFNYEQTTLPDNEDGPEQAGPDVPAPPDHLAFLLDRLNGMGVKFQPDMGGAWYAPVTDTLCMPSRPLFHKEDDYSAVLAHEMVHSTGHSSRLDRGKKGRYPDKEAYAFEELVAELGATFLCSELGVQGTYDAHESYLASWSLLFQDKKRSLLTAASAASRAFEYILTGELPRDPQTDSSQGSEARDGDVGQP